MRGKAAQVKPIKASRTSIRDESSPALSTRRSKLLQNGSTPRDSALNDSASRQSSVSLDRFGLPFDDESDAARPAKRRRREAADSPAEASSSRRVRARVSPIQSTIATNAGDVLSKSTVPGIAVSGENDESQSPGSEAASVLEPLPSIRQALRINFNAEGGGKLTISNTATPTPSVLGSARPSPAPFLNAADGEQEEIIAKQAKKIPGRRRMPHKDPKIEAAIRRQTELKKCYRTIARAMKPILVELSSRGISEMEEDDQAHKQYPEYEETMAALDYHYAKRQRELDAQLSYGLKLNEQRYQQDKEYEELRLADRILDVRDAHSMRQLKALRAVHRMNDYLLDPYNTEDDFDDELPPLRNPKAYNMSITDPNYTLDLKYDSRSRQALLLSQAADHLQCLRDFDVELKQLMKDRNSRWDRKYGPVKSAKYVEPKFDMAALSQEQTRQAALPVPTGAEAVMSSTTTPVRLDQEQSRNDGISFLLKAIQQDEAETTTEVIAHADNSAKRANAFDALFEAIELREAKHAALPSTDPTLVTVTGDLSQKRQHVTQVQEDFPLPAIAGGVLPNPSSVSPEQRHQEYLDTLVDPTLEELAPDTLVMAAPFREHDLESTPRSPPTGHELVDANAISPRQTSNTRNVTDHIEQPLVGSGLNDEYSSVVESTPQLDPKTETDIALAEPTTDGVETPPIFASPRNESEQLAIAARDLIVNEYRIRAGYVPNDWLAEAKVLIDDMNEARRYFQLSERSEADQGKFWLAMRRKRQELWLDKCINGSSAGQPATGQAETAPKASDFASGGRYAHLEIPSVYADMITAPGDDRLYSLWVRADAYIPADAARPLDRDTLMEVAELAETARYEYYNAKWLAWSKHSSKTAEESTHERLLRIEDQVVEQKQLLEHTEDRLERALGLWPTFLEKRRGRLVFVKREDDARDYAFDS